MQWSCGRLPESQPRRSIYSISAGMLGPPRHLSVRRTALQRDRLPALPGSCSQPERAERSVWLR
eukprot:3424175-Rhodomonas_salina.1